MSSSVILYYGGRRDGTTYPWDERANIKITDEGTEFQEIYDVLPSGFKTLQGANLYIGWGPDKPRLTSDDFVAKLRSAIQEN